MYAIVDIAGQQFKVEKDQQLFVHRLEGKEGSKVSFDNVLLLDEKGKVTVGAPVITGANVSAKIVEHLKGDKVIAFKKKRRKGFKVKNGFRQSLTKIQIESIAAKGGSTAKAAEAPKVEASEKKAETPKASATTAPKATVKKAAPKAEASDAKKPAAKKTTTKKDK